MASRQFRRFPYRAGYDWRCERRVIRNGEHLSKRANPDSWWRIGKFHLKENDAHINVERDDYAYSNNENCMIEKPILSADRISAATMRANQFRFCSE